MRGDHGDAVEIEALAAEDEQRHDVGEQSEPRIALTGEGRALGREGRARILQQEPVDREERRAREEPLVAPQAQLDQRLGPVAHRKDAQCAHPGRVDVDLETGRSAARLEHAIEKPVALERQLEPVIRVEAEEPAMASAGERRVEVVFRPPQIDRRGLGHEVEIAQGPGGLPIGRERLLGGTGRLDRRAGRDRRERTRAVAPRAVPVSSGQQQDERDQAVLATQRVEHQAISLDEGRGTDPPVTQTVVDGRVHAGEVVRELRAKRLHDRREHLAHRREIPGVVHVVAERDARRFHRIDGAEVPIVDRERVDRRIAGEQLPRAIAVVEIEVHDEDPGPCAVSPQAMDRHRDVVEHAEPVSAIGSGVMEAATQVDHDASPARGQARREDGAADLLRWHKRYASCPASPGSDPRVPTREPGSWSDSRYASLCTRRKARSDAGRARCTSALRTRRWEARNARTRSPRRRSIGPPSGSAE